MDPTREPWKRGLRVAYEEDNVVRSLLAATKAQHVNIVKLKSHNTGLGMT